MRPFVPDAPAPARLLLAEHNIRRNGRPFDRHGLKRAGIQNKKRQDRRRHLCCFHEGGHGPPHEMWVRDRRTSR